MAQRRSHVSAVVADRVSAAGPGVGVVIRGHVGIAADRNRTFSDQFFAYASCFHIDPAARIFMAGCDTHVLAVVAVRAGTVVGIIMGIVVTNYRGIITYGTGSDILFACAGRAHVDPSERV